MGMFDALICKYKEMPEEHRKLIYQTKSLCCAMELYMIDEQGKLFVEQYETIEKENPDYDSEKWWSFPTYTEKINKEWVERPVTEKISFYDKHDETDEWIQYCVMYVKGKLVHFEREYKNG